MSERGRGLYGDALAAAGVLAALGVAPTTAMPKAEYRGRCGNGAHGRDDGCPNEIAPPPNPLRLCSVCADRYMQYDVRQMPEASRFGAIIALPQHEPCGTEGCGRLNADNTVVCTETREFSRCDCKRSPDTPTRGHKDCDKCHSSGSIISRRNPTNCGAVFALDAHGIRVRVDVGRRSG